MRILKKRLIAICLVLAVIFAGFSNTLVSADADKKDDFVLNIDFNVLRKCGFQKNGTGWCACDSLAYCRALLDGKKHSKDEFHAAGSEYADWKSAGYEKKTYSATNAGAKKLWKKLYKTLSKGRPAIIYTCGSGSYGHYVTIVGYKDVTNINNLSEKNFIFIDSMAAAATRDESGKLRHVVQSLDDKYSLAPNGGHYEIVLTKEKGQSDAVLSKSKAKALLGDLKSISFKVSAPKTSISKCSISLLKKTYEYSGNKIKAKVKVKF